MSEQPIANGSSAAGRSPGGATTSSIRDPQDRLPALIGVVLAFLFFSPLEDKQEVSFLLDKNKVETAPERLKRQPPPNIAARTIRAGRSSSAPARRVQQTSANPVVEISDMHAQIQLRQRPGPARSAGRARYNMDTRSCARGRPDPVHRRRRLPDGTRDVDVDLRDRTHESRGARRGPDAARHISPPASSTSNLPDRPRRPHRPRPLAYRPGRPQMSGDERAPFLLALLPPARGRARARPAGRRSPALKGTTATRRSTSAPTGSRSRTAPTAPSSPAMSRRAQGNMTMNSARLTVVYANGSGAAAPRSSGSRRPAASPLRTPDRDRAQPIRDLRRAAPAGHHDRRRHISTRAPTTSRAAGWCSTSTATAR